MNKLKSIYASAHSATVTILTVTVVTIYSELYTQFKNWLASFTGHHWVTKSYMSLIVFALFYILLFSVKQSVSSQDTRKALVIMQVVTILGFISILGFYVYEFL